MFGSGEANEQGMKGLAATVGEGSALAGRYWPVLIDVTDSQCRPRGRATLERLRGARQPLAWRPQFVQQFRASVDRSSLGQLVAAATQTLGAGIAAAHRSARRYGTVALIGAAITACTRGGGVPSPSPSVSSSPQPSTRIADTVWYISARARVDGRDSRRFADSLEYGYVVHTYRRRANPLVDGLDIALNDSIALSRDEFVNKVRLAVSANSAPNDFALLYVHGYSTSLHECWHHVAEARARSGAAVPWVAFCWPSNGLGIATPTRGAIFDHAYRDDSTAAVASGPAFVRATEVVLDAIPPSRLLLVAHSMGAQLLSDVLLSDIPREEASLRLRFTRERVRGIAFVAPDVDARRFADTIVPALSSLSSRIVAYTSGRDRMLLLSRQRSGTPRAGLRQSNPLVRTQLETIDVTDGVVAENNFQHIFGTHHSIHRASALVFDLVHIVGAGRAPDCRAILGTAVLTPPGVWALTHRRPELDGVAEQCAVMKTTP